MTTARSEETVDDLLERMQADGRLSVDDADEVRTFAAFLNAVGPAPQSGGARVLTVLREHYPDDPNLPENQTEITDDRNRS